MSHFCHGLRFISSAVATVRVLPDILSVTRTGQPLRGHCLDLQHPERRSAVTLHTHPGVRNNPQPPLSTSQKRGTTKSLSLQGRPWQPKSELPPGFTVNDSQEAREGNKGETLMH